MPDLLWVLAMYTLSFWNNFGLIRLNCFRFDLSEFYFFCYNQSELSVNWFFKIVHVHDVSPVGLESNTTQLSLHVV